MNKSKSFTFTTNNYTPEDEEHLRALFNKGKVEYLVYGREVGESGTPHLQGFIRFKSQRSIRAVSKDIPRSHLEYTKGDLQSNYLYCTKDEDYVELGTRPYIKPGKRNDLEDIKRAVNEGESLPSIVEKYVSNYQQLKFAENLEKYRKPKKYNPKKVIWLYGPPGSGKSRWAMDHAPDDDWYISMRNLKWWDGYTGQSYVILDDFRGDFCTFHELLRILDVYPYRVETKGSSIYLQATTIVITSCMRPESVYNTREDIEQLLRRISEVREFK